MRLTAFGLLLGLDALPDAVRQERVPIGIAEHMRMPPDHLARDRVGHIAEVEARILRGHLRVINHLEQEIAELVLERVEIVARDRVGNLISLFDGVGRDGGEALLDVPRAAGVLVAQPRHDGEQVVERVAFLRRVSHRAGQTSHAAPGSRGAQFVADYQRDSGTRSFSAPYPRFA